jgi:hypothetical protein
MTDWLPLSRLTPDIERARAELTETRKREREAAETKLEAEREAAKAKARQEAEAAAAQEAKLRKFQARLYAPQPWKCLTCSHVFAKQGTIHKFPAASGIGTAIFLFVGALIFAISAFQAPEPTNYILFLCAGVIMLYALGSQIAYSIEKGLQQFHSYHPRCPNCSSPHYANVEEDV